MKCSLPFGIPNFILSPFYSRAGSADALGASLAGDEARELFAAQLAYYRAEPKRAERIVERLLEREICFETRVGCANAVRG